MFAFSGEQCGFQCIVCGVVYLYMRVVVNMIILDKTRFRIKGCMLGGGGGGVNEMKHKVS